MQRERPIFLLGVGRCGSTFQQVALNRLPDVWIWGEHDGIIGNLLRWGAQAVASDNLQKFAFSRSADDPSLALQVNLRINATSVAWLNGFRPVDLEELQYDLISQLFKKGLPVDKGRWGFKEIRYGPDDKVPERLLSLFPESKIVHTLRNPFATVESTMFAWHLPRLLELLEQGRNGEVQAMYERHIVRWERMTRYFLDLEQKHPSRVKTSKLETFGQTQVDLMAFLDVPSAGVDPINGEELVNMSFRGSKAYQAQAEQLKLNRPIFANLIEATAVRAGYDLPDLIDAPDIGKRNE